MNQTQSEALLSLIVLSIFTDSTLSLKEDESLSAAIESIEWQSKRPREIYLLTAMSRARAAAENDAATRAFVKEKSALFSDLASQALVLKTLQAVLASDGTSENEERFLFLVKGAFPV